MPHGQAMVQTLLLLQMGPLHTLRLIIHQMAIILGIV